MHARFLPPDDGQLRQEAPEQQQLIQITEYSVVLGNQRQSNQQPIPITTPTLLRLKGKPLSKGATLAQVLIQFDSEGKSLKKPVYDAGTRTLTLNYRWRSTRRCSTCCATRRSIASSSPIPTAMSGRTCTPARYARVEPRRAPGVNCLVLSRAGRARPQSR